jgi:hypothetical protein
MSTNALRILITALVSRVCRLTFCATIMLILGLLPTTSAAQPFPPGEVELDGSVEVLHEDRDVGSRYIYFLNTPAGERLEMVFGANPPALVTGERIRARGRRTNGVLAFSSGGSVQTLAAALPNTFGPQKTLVILVNFSDKTTQPYTISTAQSVFSTTSNFDLENSFNQTWLTGVSNPGTAADIVGWFTINLSYTVCDSSKTVTLAEQAAAAAGVDLSQYNRRVYAFAQNNCSWWGLGTVGGNPSRAWINGSLQLRVVAHEMGHNLGLYHSHSLDCGAAVIGGVCTSSDYGDYFDTMGSSAYHYNAYQKERLSWLNYDIMPPITSVTTDGIYWISPYQANTNDPKALKILKSVDSSGRRTYYYLEARRAIGFDAGLASNTNVMNGVLVHLGTESSGNSSYLLDMTPATSSWTDPALTAGQTYSDPDAGVTITVLSVDNTGATVSVTLAGGGTASCIRANPSVTLTPASQTVAAGGSATHTVTVTNTDSSACTASSFNLTSSMPTGLSGTFGAPTLNLSPGSSSSTTLQVAAASSLAAGSYAFNITAKNGAATSYTKTASGSENVVTSLAVAVSTDKPSYARNQQVTVSATVTSGGAPLANVAVTFTITKANGSIVTGNATTGSNGMALYKLRLKKQDPVGSYQAKAAGTMSGISGSAMTSFMVQ